MAPKHALWEGSDIFTNTTMIHAFTNNIHQTLTMRFETIRRKLLRERVTYIPGQHTDKQSLTGRTLKTHFRHKTSITPNIRKVVNVES